MRAFATSSVNAVMLVQRWVTPGAVGLVIAISGISSLPSAVLTTPATLPLRMQCAHGYSGCIGVSAIGCQAASRSVAGLLSISALRIAVTGRQKLYWYLASNTPAHASLGAIAASAMSHALATTSMPLSLARYRPKE